MKAETIVSFIRYIRVNPDLAHDRKEFVKNVNKSGDLLFKMKKEQLRRSIDVQKKDLAACFDIWDKFSKEYEIDILHADGSEIEAFIEAAVKAFNIEIETEPDITSDEQTNEKTDQACDDSEEENDC